MIKIVGIILVRNEDRFIAQVIKNITAFCDQILLVDHGSTDGTVAILEHLQEQDAGKISLHHIKDAKESHDLLRPFIGTDTWIFAVDGDELYDTSRLLSFRKRMIAGDFKDYWMVMGNVLHCDELDTFASTAFGYFSPPSRSITKLYNFAAIEAWEGDSPERLHGGTPHFRDGFNGEKKRSLQYEYSWDKAPFRCLHLCFIPRSSKNSSAMRKNIMETLAPSSMSRLLLLAQKNYYKIFHKNEFSRWKKDHYARGDRQRIDARPFLG